MNEDIKNKIIYSGYQLLLEKDITQITTREIAEKADVSLSLQHYYFKSKFDLFNHIMEVETPKFHNQWKAENLDLENPTIIDFENYWYKIMNGIYQFPTFARSMIHLFLKGYKNNSFSIEVMNDLKNILIKLLPELHKDAIERRLLILGSVINSFRVTRDNVFDSGDFDITDEEQRTGFYKGILLDVLPELYRS